MSSQVTWKLSLFSVLFGITLAFSIAPCASAQDPPLERVVIKIPLSPVSVECDAKCGIAEFDGDSMAYIALAGEPAVPYQIAHILLPPDADLSSVQATLEQIRTEKMPGEWEVAPTPPLATWDDGKQIIIWPPDKTIVEGRDVAIYESDALFPSSLLGNMTSGYMRQWALVTIPFATYQYNPVQKTLLRVIEADLVVTFARLSPTLAESQQRVAASDTISEESVRRLAVNYEQMAPAYAAPTGESRAAGAGTGYVILTTQAIQRQSGELSSFVANKEKLGFTVHVVTETEWGGGVGDQAAENIRNWLAAHYASLQVEYVLLVGNPDTTTGDIPMKMLWPLHGLGHNEDAPTDFYYSDLTGNWDLDGDGFFGEDPGDLGLGGVDFNWEVLVGRIPFYGSFSDLDHILAKSIAYENAYDDTIAWRKNALLPMMRSDAETPGYHLGEAITNDILAAAGGWRQHRNYEESFGLTPPPESVCDTIPCVGNESKVADIWRGTPFGAVFWWTHGGPTGATYVMDSSLAATLDDGHPSFTFQASCLNAQPEAESNLAYSLLKNGAVGTIGATRVSWYAPGQTSFKNPYTNYTNSGMAYEYAMRMIRYGMESGRSLHDLKQFVRYNLANWAVFNLYGDPSLGIHSAVARPSHLTVTSSADSGPGTLRSAIEEIATAGVIDFSLPAPSTITLNCTPLVIERSITIHGPGEDRLTISGNGCTRLFEVRTGASLTIDNVRMQNGAAHAKVSGVLESGGAVQNEGDLTITNCLLTNNDADVGGAIYSTGNMTVTYSVLKNNQAKVSYFPSGAVYGGHGGAVYTRIGYARVMYSVLEDNVADAREPYGGAAGGAIFNEMGVLGVYRTTLERNVATGHASGAGGGIYSSGGTVIVTDSTLRSNGAYGRYTSGGAIHNADYDMVVLSSTISENGTSWGVGGAIHNGGWLRLVNTTVSDNFGTSPAGGIHNTGHLTLQNNTVANNGQAGIYNRGEGVVQVKNTIMADNISNCAGDFFSNGYNLDSDGTCGFYSPGDMTGVKAHLGLLADNGGPTWTRALLAESPAIDAGDSADCPETDQRGFVRPRDGNGDGRAECDMGAFEVQEPLVRQARITIAVDAIPDSPRNFRFVGTLGNFRLDNPGEDDGDSIAESVSYVVDPGAYTFAEIVPYRWFLTNIDCNSPEQAVKNLPAFSVTIDVHPADDVTCTFVNEQSATIRVRSYWDKNGTGQRDGREPWMSGWQIMLYDQTDTVVAYGFTNDLGKWNINDVRPGQYTACQVFRDGWVNTQPGVGDPNHAGWPCYEFSVEPAQLLLLYFGNVQAGAVTASADSTVAAQSGVEVVDGFVDEENDEAYTVDEFVDRDLTSQDEGYKAFLPVVTR